MVSHHRLQQHREPTKIKPLKKELEEYWTKVLKKTARVIQRMTVPQLVRLVSDDIFAVKTGCDFLEKNETTIDLHVNQLIRIVVEEKLHDYLRCEERIMRESAKVEKKLDTLMKINQANKSIFSKNTKRPGKYRLMNEHVTNSSRCSVM